MSDRVQLRKGGGVVEGKFLGDMLPTACGFSGSWRLEGRKMRRVQERVRILVQGMIFSGISPGTVEIGLHRQAAFHAHGPCLPLALCCMYRRYGIPMDSFLKTNTIHEIASPNPHSLIVKCVLYSVWLL